jgi:hypothetical protein
MMAAFVGNEDGPGAGAQGMLLGEAGELEERALERVAAAGEAQEQRVGMLGELV